MTTEAPTRTEPLTLRERRQLRTRTDLVSAVLAVIAADGADALTIDRVGVESGISRGTIYAHFSGGRDELLRAAYARLGTDLVARTQAAVAQASGWKKRLTAHAATMFELAGDPHLGRFYNVSGPALITDGAERGIGSGASTAMIRQTLEEAQRSGEVDAEADAGAVAILLVGAMREAAIGVAGGTADPERAFAAFSRLLDGLAAR